MKANLTNLRKALKVCAKAHNCDFNDWSDEGQLGVWSTTPATICDVRMICEAFFGSSEPAEVSDSVNCITVWLCYEFLPEVDEDKMYLALPYGTKLN
jgi:hypothetical protein